MDDVVLHDIYKRGLAILLDASGRHQRYFPQHLHQQPDIDELIWKQREIVVVKSGPQLQRAGGGIDLVIERLKRAGGELRLPGAIIRLN